MNLLERALSSLGFTRNTTQRSGERPKEDNKSTTGITPGRVSVPNDGHNFLASVSGLTESVNTSFLREVIPLIRQLYKVNPDMSIALNDMFKLTNTGHRICFPNNTDEEAEKMRQHLKTKAQNWSSYTAGIDGLVNKFIVQCLVGGAISVEAVPNQNLDGISTILFVNPEDIIFNRASDGVYEPYQINKRYDKVNKPYIKLNPQTYKYVGMYNDTDEPYGVPPFLASLDSIKTQADMKTNFKQIMELMGMLGFLEAKLGKPDRLGGESVDAYQSRLTQLLSTFKKNLHNGMKDGVVVGFMDDHEFKMNSTTKDLNGVDKVWSMNQQSLSNGLGVNGTLIGVQSTNTEGGAGILLSKMISQLKNIQLLVSHTLQFLYSLELRLAGFNNKGITVEFSSSTISDEVKIQQGLEYKIRNFTALYQQGIIGQDRYAFEMGYAKPDRPKPRPLPKAPTAPGQAGTGIKSPEAAAKKKKRVEGKSTSARKGRDKEKKIPKRKDQKTKP